jgi:GTPase SAR1 family protein
MSQRYRAYMDHDEPITDGIDIKTWNIPIQETSDQLMFSVWDFAGQTVYYNTHQVTFWKYT